MRPSVLIALGVVAPVVLLTAQAPARPQNPPTFTAGIDVVKLDVSVYDKDHRPIKGLTAADFTLIEDKLPRPIVGFAEVDIPEPPPPTATWMRDATEDVATNDVAEKRLFLIVIDDHSFAGRGVPRPTRGLQQPPQSFDPPQSLSFKGNREVLIAAARSVINRLGPTDLGAVVFVSDTRQNQEFTSDHGRLIAAVEKTLRAEPYGNPNADAVATLYQAANDLIGVAAKRKAIVDITNDTECLQDFKLASAERVFKGAQQAGIRFYMMRPAATFPVCKGAYGSAMSTPDLNALAQDEPRARRERHNPARRSRS